MTRKELSKLKVGTKVIFVKEGGGYGKINTVHTFAYKLNDSEWSDWPGWWRSQEMLDAGMSEHDQPCDKIEVFDPETHKDPIFIKISDIVQKQRELSAQLYGS